MHITKAARARLGEYSNVRFIESAVESEVRFMVCTMSMGIMGIQKRDLMDLPNLEFGGVTCFVEQARDSRMALVF